MKHLLLLTTLSFAVALLLHTISNKADNIELTVSTKLEERESIKQFGLGCSPNLAEFDLEDSSNIIPLLSGWGDYRMPVTVKDDSAAIFFQQGINMYYGFHIIESLASFERAVKFDSTFAMGYWGKALAYGPNINDLGYAASPEALASVMKAKSLSNNCTPVEKALIEAMALRYSEDSSKKRTELNQLYADAMKNVYKNFPTSADAAALYADALMVQHPWDLYDRTYKPKAWTPEIVMVLEDLVKKFPNNPGASHYYIHAVEGSEEPEKALPVADRLGAMMPGLAHLVHMPSHIYIRSGYYKKGAEVNEDAINQYQNYLGKYKPVSNNNFIYLIHNLHMQASCAAMDMRYADASRSSEATRLSFDSSWQDAAGFFGSYIQYLYMTPYFNHIRFGKWQEVMNTPAPPSSRVYAKSIWHYGRGMALARKHKFPDATKELQRLRDSLTSVQLQEHPDAFNPGIASLKIAEMILQGTILQEAGESEKAIAAFKKAVINEDDMLYNEPRDWPHPARQYLGDAYLQAKLYADAEKIFKEDLKINPNNGWSLTGLLEAAKMQAKTAEIKPLEKRLKNAVKESDVKITRSVF